MTAQDTPADSPTKRVLAVVLFNLLVYIVTVSYTHLTLPTICSV